jgi:acyl carrier protein
MAGNGSWIPCGYRKRGSRLNESFMIDRKQVLSAMGEYFAENFPDVPQENFEGMKASDVIKQSLDLVEFVLHLEERLGIEININTLGEKLITKTLGELADDLIEIANAPTT